VAITVTQRGRGSGGVGVGYWVKGIRRHLDNTWIRFLHSVGGEKNRIKEIIQEEKMVVEDSVEKSNGLRWV